MWCLPLLFLLSLSAAMLLLLTKMPSGNGHGFFTLGEAMQCIGERGGPLGGPRTRDGSSHLVRPPDY